MSADVEVIHGDCLAVMRRLADASVDAVCTDPPYDLESGNGRGFMGRAWDGTGIAFRVELWTEVFRVLKPGGHLLAFGGTRTYHRMTCAIEDAGFEIRDSIHWIYGSGFPKSLNLEGEWNGFGTALKPSHEPIVLARNPLDGTVAQNVAEHGTGALNIDRCRIGTNELITNHSRSEEAAISKGRYGDSRAQSNHQTSGQEIGRWPSNLVLTHHPDCRPCGTKRVKSGTAYEPDPKPMSRSIYGATETLGRECGYADADGLETVEAWECVESGCPVAEMDRQSGERKAGARPSNRGAGTKGYHGWPNGTDDGVRIEFDSGGASRFFPRFAWETDDFPFRYCGKASREERNVGLDGMPERRTRQVRLRDDLTDEELAYVMRELKSAGVSV